MSYGLIFILAAGLALALYIRLAPNDAALWHVQVADASSPIPGPCVEQIRTVPKGARATCLLPGTPAEILAKLDTIALATPRTTRLAGSPDEGRITWVSRSRLLGYPDYITAEASPTPQGSRLDIFSRQRYGSGDWGVNAARLTAWLAQL
jgi:uncharacterized protein (DUF1499 family)